MKISKQKVCVSATGEMFLVTRLEYKPAQAVYEYEFPIKKNKNFSTLVGASPKSLGLRHIGAL